MVEQEILEHRTAEGPADEKSNHRLSQCRVALTFPASAARPVRASGEGTRWNAILNSRCVMPLPPWTAKRHVCGCH
jgi:hypothetical protein